MIDAAQEQTLTFEQAAARLPRPVHLAWVHRWATRGIPGPDGTRIRLEAVKVGCRWATSVEALGRFLAATTAAATANRAEPINAA
jgi:hypothetical protein